MKGKSLHSKSAELASANDDARREIDDFLRALESYPLGFAAEPGISFDDYRSQLRMLTRAGPFREPKSNKN
jgi:hypothetical protein